MEQFVAKNEIYQVFLDDRGASYPEDQRIVARLYGMEPAGNLDTILVDSFGIAAQSTQRQRGSKPLYELTADEVQLYANFLFSNPESINSIKNESPTLWSIASSGDIFSPYDSSDLSDPRALLALTLGRISIMASELKTDTRPNSNPQETRTESKPSKGMKADDKFHEAWSRVVEPEFLAHEDSPQEEDASHKARDKGEVEREKTNETLREQTRIHVSQQEHEATLERIRSILREKEKRSRSMASGRDFER